jgi:hypothetical protein
MTSRCTTVAAELDVELNPNGPLRVRRLVQFGIGPESPSAFGLTGFIPGWNHETGRRGAEAIGAQVPASDWGGRSVGLV